MAARTFLPPSLERLPHNTTRLELHTFATEAVVRLAMTERIDRRGDQVIREFGWRAPAPTFLRYHEQFTALRDFWDLELPRLGFAERPVILEWREVPGWCRSQQETIMRKHNR